MPLYPILFVLVVTVGLLFSLFRGPVYGLMTYVYIYFNIPSNQWWGDYFPDFRWSFLSAILLTVAVIVHAQKLGKIRFGLRSPATYLILLLLLMCVIAPFSYSPELAWHRVYDFFRYVYIYILAVIILADINKYKLFLYSLIINFLYLAYLAHSYFSGGRLDGVGLVDADDANMLAALTLLIIPFLIQFLVHGSRKEKILSLITFILIVNVFVMCGSRGASIGLFFELIILLFFYCKKTNFVKVFFLFSAITLSIWMLMDNSFKERLFSFSKSSAAGDFKEISSGRIDIWAQGTKMLRDYPFGTGGGGFITLSPSYLNSNLIEKNTGNRASHNTYLLLLIEQGPLGLTFYFGFILSTFFALFKLKINIEKKMGGGCLTFEQNFVLGQVFAITTALAGFWIASFFIDRLYFEGIYFIAAMAAALSGDFIKNSSF